MDGYGIRQLNVLDIVAVIHQNIILRIKNDFDTSLIIYLVDRNNRSKVAIDYLVCVPSLNDSVTNHKGLMIHFQKRLCVRFRIDHGLNHCIDTVLAKVTSGRTFIKMSGSQNDCPLHAILGNALLVLLYHARQDLVYFWSCQNTPCSHES